MNLEGKETNLLLACVSLVIIILAFVLEGTQRPLAITGGALFGWNLAAIIFGRGKKK